MFKEVILFVASVLHNLQCTDIELGPKLYDKNKKLI